MHYEVIQQKLKKQPFEPFEIVTSSGDRYPVTHPDRVLVTQRSLVVAVARKNSRAPIPQGYADVSYLHVASLDPIQQNKPSRRSA